MSSPKCTYKKGDIIKKGDTLGLVVAANYRDVEFQMVNGEKLNTVNMSINHYLKIMKAWNKLNTALITRNITLEQELLESSPAVQEDFVSGHIDRLEL